MQNQNNKNLKLTYDAVSRDNPAWDLYTVNRHDLHFKVQGSSFCHNAKRHASLLVVLQYNDVIYRSTFPRHGEAYAWQILKKSKVPCGVRME